MPFFANTSQNTVGKLVNSKLASETLDDLDDIYTRRGAKIVGNAEQIEPIDIYIDSEAKAYTYNVTSFQAGKIKKYIWKYQNDFRTAVVKLNGEHLDDLIALTERHGDDFLRVINDCDDTPQMLNRAVLADDCLISNRFIDKASDEWSQISKYYNEYAKEIRPRFFKNDNGNVAYTEICIDGHNVKKYKAISKNDSIDGFVNLLGEKNTATDPKRKFRTEWLNRSGDITNDEAEIAKSYNRCVDTEAKTLEQIANDFDDYIKSNSITGKQIKPSDIKGTINMFTERKPCKSCEKVIEQFMEMFPNVTLNVYWIRN